MLSSCFLLDSRAKVGTSLRILAVLASAAAISSASPCALNYHAIKLF